MSRQISLFFLLMYFHADAQFNHEGRGMYVDRFFRTSMNSSGAEIIDQNFSILGLPAKENALLQFAKENHITYLILYDLHRVLGNPVYENYLCDFLEKAKMEYCVEKFGVASSCAAMFGNVASIAPAPPVSRNLSGSESAEFVSAFKLTKQSLAFGDKNFRRAETAKLGMHTATFNENCTYKFDVLVTEFEFWNSGTDNCTEELLTKDQKYQNYQEMINDMDAIRDNYNASHPDHKIYVETYLGFLNQNTAYSHQQIADWIDGSYNGNRRVDRINLHYYGTNPATLYSRTASGVNHSGYYQTRFLDFSQSSTNNNSIVQPIFSSENTSWGAGFNFLGIWFNQGVSNNIFTAEKIWYNDWIDDAKNYHQSTIGDSILGSDIKPGRAVWYSSAFLLDHQDSKLLFTSNSPVCVSAGQTGVPQFSYNGPIEQGVSFRFYITDFGGSTLQCGDMNYKPWPVYDPLTGQSINLDSALGICSLPVGDYEAHLELVYDTCSSCSASCAYIIPPMKISVTSTGQIVALTSTTACQGNPVYLQANSTAGGTTTYLWYDGNSQISGATSSTFAPVSTGLRNYSCRITSSISGCSANRSNVIPVTINTYPSASISLQSTSGCTAVLRANPTGNTYSWQNGSTASTYSASYKGNYSVAVTKSGCTSYASFTHRTVQADVVQLVHPCNGLSSGSVTLNLYWGLWPYSLSWSGPVSGSSSGLSPGHRTISNIPSGSYAITVTDDNGCSKTINVVLQADSFSPPTVNTPVCAGDTIKFDGGDGILFLWSGPAGFSSILENPVIPNSTSANSGSYYVTVTRANGCSSSFTLLATVHSLPSATTSSNSPVCAGDSMKLYSSGGLQYSWIGPGGFTSAIQNPVFISQALSAGNYTVSVIDNHNCVDTALVNVTVQIPSVYYADLDGDGYGDILNFQLLCSASGIYNTLIGGDCNDGAGGMGIHPGAYEICGNGIDEDCDGIADDSCFVSLQVKLFIEGFYQGAGSMIAVLDPNLLPVICDSLTLELHNSISPHHPEYISRSVVTTTGNAVFLFPTSVLSGAYFIAVSHRNTLETWSNNSILFDSAAEYFDFTTAASNAYGNNLSDLGDGNFGLLSGDVLSASSNQDGIIDMYDLAGVMDATNNFLTGYVIFDLDGNGIVESADFSIVETNAGRIVTLARP